MRIVVERKLYDTETAELVADNEFANGSNRLNTGRASNLYRTRKGNFFSFHETCWQGEHNSIHPLMVDEAKDMYESLPNHSMSWEQAFGEPPEEA